MTFKKCFGLTAVKAMESQGYCTARQPIIKAASDRTECFEVGGHELLARHRRLGITTPPNQFLYTFTPDQSATMDVLAAMDAIDYVLSTPDQKQFVTFNCSVRNLLRNDFTEYLVSRMRILDEEDRRRIVLEITETERVETERASERVVGGNWSRLTSNVTSLHSLGIKIAIDDFGCGNACLRLVRTLPIDIIKYSRHVIADLASDAKSLLTNTKSRVNTDDMSLDLMKSISATMRNWGCLVIVEGIETQEDITLAEDLGADFLQGYLFGRPYFEEDLLPNNCQFGLAVRG